MADRRRCHPDAERHVLGACLLAAVALDLVEALVAPASFYVPAHGVIFEAMLAVRDRKSVV